MAGGVSANKRLQARLEQSLAKIGAKVFYARQEFCTDNGAMIAFAGAQRLNVKQYAELSIQVRPRWNMEQLPPLATDK
jgi:N6-L-threonylcarbamoyladenine synthase